MSPPQSAPTQYSMRCLLLDNSLRQLETMSSTTAYRNWCSRVAVDLPNLESLLLSIPCMHLNQRKALLTATRVQSYPHSDSRLFERLKEIWVSKVYLDFDSQPRSSRESRQSSNEKTLRTLCDPCESLFPSPTFCGFISAVVRSAPTNFPEEYEDARESGFSKEILASIQVYHPTTLSFDCIFSTSELDRDLPIAPNLEGNPHIGRVLHSAFSSVRHSLSGTVLYPKCGRKTIGRVAAENFWKSCPLDFREKVWEEHEATGGVTTTMMQKLEFYEGIRSDGPVEIRSSWKYGDLKPRIYFALGGETFHASKYVQKIFNMIADSIEPTHTKNRHLPPDEELNDEECVIIYDYESFTSNLQAIVEFVYELANFMSGTVVYLVGHRDGITPMDLGELLHEYANSCNLFSDFDIGPILGLDLPFILGHTCGMLGVPGNIQSSTILHGIHLSFITESLKRCRCIGDDAKMFKRLSCLEDEMILEQQLRNIGRIALEKMEFFEFDEDDDYELRAWHYAKRPLMRTYNHIITFYLATFPTLDCILGLRDPNRTTLPDASSLNSRRNKFFSIWLRLLTVISVEGGIEEEEIRFLYTFQRVAFKELGIIGYRAGSHREDDKKFLVPPFFEPEDFGRDPCEKVLEDFSYEEEVEVMSIGSYIFWPSGYVGETFCSKNHPLLSFLTKMGLVDRKLKTEVVSKKTVGDVLFSSMLLGRVSACYEWTILHPLPLYVYTLMS